MATLIPGYDFSITEEVTASKLMKWLLGCTLDGTIGYASAEIGTGFSLSGMTNEGDLEVNFSTGKVNVRTRWGMVPVMGGGMFTKRCAMYHNDPDPSGWNQSAFFDCYYKLGPHGNRATTFSLADPSSMGPGIGPDNAYCYASNIYSDSGYNTIASFYPLASQYRPQYIKIFFDPNDLTFQKFSEIAFSHVKIMVKARFWGIIFRHQLPYLFDNFNALLVDNR